MSTQPAKPRPKIERLPPLPPADKIYHPLRKRIHLICFLIFVALPFFNVMRADIPRQRFYFAGFELWINEFGIIFFALMFLMFLIAASAIVYGRIYCSYACPQMIFSEWSTAVERWSKKIVTKRYPKWPGPKKARAAGAIFYSVLSVASVFLAFVFTSYFVEPRDLLSRLLHFDIVTAGGITGATVTLITFLDFTFVRQTFCTTVCPYGYLQGMLQDKNSLLVLYRDGQGDKKVCIECQKCVRVCEMEIDIRHSPYQIECVHCGECIDACEDVLRKIGRPGLIGYTWGEQEKLHQSKEEVWYRRWGFRDSKRFAILLLLLFYVSGLTVALSMRRPVLVRVAPDRAVLYQVLPDGRVANKMRLKMANRSSQPASVRIWTEGLPGAEVALLPEPLTLAAAQSEERIFEIRAPHTKNQTDVNRFRVAAQATGTKTPEYFDMTFIMPVDKQN